MSADSPKSIPKLRTFAQDVERARQKSGMISSAPNGKPVETPKLSAVKSTTVTTSSVASAPKSAAEGDAHIPAFHELQKKSPAPQKEPPITVSVPASKPTPAPKRTVSVRARKQDLKTTKHVGGGTIITDSKTDRFKLFPSIIKSIDDWIKEIKRSFKKKAEPKYVITDTERRRGVIQKATSKTGSIFTADNETLREQIRRRQQQAPEKEPDINWSPNTEPGYALLESGTPKIATSNVTVEFKKQSTPTAPVQPAQVPTPAPKPILSKPAAPVVPPPVIVEPTVTAPIEPEPAPIAPPAETTIDETPEPEEITSSPEQVSEEPVFAEQEEYELTTPEEHYKIRSLGDIARINTNVLSIGIVGAIAGLIILIVLIRALVGFILPDNSGASLEPATPLTSTAFSAADVSLAELSTQGIISILDQNSYPALTELRFIDNEQQLISTEDILPHLGFTKHVSLNRSISDVRMIIRGDDRALVLKVTDPATTFGSLLASEGTLLTDVAPILEIDTTNLAGQFNDKRIGNTDVRVYISEASGELLVYGFIDSNTVVIAKNISFFTTVLGSN